MKPYTQGSSFHVHWVPRESLGSLQGALQPRSLHLLPSPLTPIMQEFEAIHSKIT